MIIVNNKKKIVRKMNFLFILLILVFSKIILSFILNHLITYYLRWPLFLMMILFIILIFKSIRSLKVFQFENTGSTFTIKYYHPLNKRIIFPYIELPISSIERFKVEKKILKPDLLKINILIKEKNKIVRFRLKVSGLNDESYSKMENSLQKIL